MKARFKGITVTTQDILAAMRHFDTQFSNTNDYDAWLEKENYKYAVRHEGRLYPCKHILSQVTGVDTGDFNGGEQTNSVFRRLGFEVINKPQ